MKIMKRIILLLLVLIPSTLVRGQTVTRLGVTVPSGITLPATCNPTNLFYVTVAPTGTYLCTATNIWTIYDNVIPPVTGVIVAKTITAITNNVFTNVLTFTIPNTATGALVEVTAVGSLGAGGAIGAFESSAGRALIIMLTRVPGLATATSLVNVQTATDVNVVGASAIALSTQLSALSGANNATQTISLQVRINAATGASTNHVASVVGRVVSPIPTSITVQ